MGADAPGEAMGEDAAGEERGPGMGESAPPRDTTGRETARRARAARRRIGRAFLLIAGLGALLMVTGVALLGAAGPGGAPVLAGAILLLCLVAAWAAVDALLLRPVAALAAELRLAAHAAAPAIAPGRHDTLSPLPEAAAVLAASLGAAREAVAATVARTTAELEAQRSRLAAILNDLPQGVLVCNLAHQVLLYNRGALTLPGLGAGLGLGRDLLRRLSPEPVLEALARLRGDEAAAPEERHAEVVVTADAGRVRLRGRMGLVVAGGAVTGYVLTLAEEGAMPPGAKVTPAPLPPRPEFFDFDLLHQPLATGALGRTPLDRLSHVVFDTETTGLEPRRGDALLSIGAVRILNGRILTGETFQALIHPGRRIPQGSTRFHGITDAMVADSPPAAAVVPAFHAFAEHAVLVAHNAAFDLAFLREAAGPAGVRFANPVLDTMILARFLLGEEGAVSLDALAARLGVPVEGRHSALGDALATAGIFLRLVAMLKTRGIVTLDEAIGRSNMLVALRAGDRDF